MRPHPYLRAYMAGIVVPTMFLLVAFTIYAYFRFLAAPSDFIAPLVSRPFERAIVFPLAVVPNLWGAWNMLHMALRRRTRLPLALHGALLPILLVPSGVLLGRALDVFTHSMAAGRHGHSHRHGRLLPGVEIPGRIPQRRDGDRGRVAGSWRPAVNMRNEGMG